MAALEPSARCGSLCSLVGGKTYLWGGLGEEVSLKEFAAAVYTFDPYLETWATLKPGGSPPSGSNGCGCASTGRYLYAYGGCGAKPSYGYDCSLHSLDTKKMTWTKLASPETGPMKKQGCGMVAYNNKLLLFGGSGVPYGPTQPGSKFILDDWYANGQGWTNEMHTFDLKTSEGS